MLLFRWPLIGWVLAMLMFPWQGSAFASEAGVVVLVVDADDPGGSSWPLGERRLVAELEAVGLNVVRAPSPNLERGGGVSQEELKSLSEVYRAVGAARLTRDESGGHIYLYVAGETTLRLIEVPEAQVDQPSGAASAVLGAVELLHEAGLSIDLSANADEPGGRDEGQAPPEKAATRVVPSGGPRGGYFTSRDYGLVAGVGAGLSVSTTEFHPVLVNDFVVGVTSNSALSVEAQASLTPIGRETDAGRLRYFAPSLLAVVDFSSSATLRPSFALGPTLLVAWTAFDGPSHGGRDDSDVLVGAVAQLRLDYALSDSAGLRLGVGLLWTARTLRTDAHFVSLSTGEELDFESSLSHTPIADSFVLVLFR